MYVLKGFRGEALQHKSPHAVQVFVPGSPAPVPQPSSPTTATAPAPSVPWYSYKLFGIVPVWMLILGLGGFVGYKYFYKK